MRLAYSIPNKLWWIHDFLSFDMYKGIHDSIIKERKNINLHNTRGLWSEDLISHIKAPDRVGVSNYPPFLKLETYVGNSLVIVKSPLEHKVNPIRSKIMPRITIQIFMK